MKKSLITIAKDLIAVTLAIFTIIGLQTLEGYPMDNIPLRMGIGGFVFSVYIS